MTGDVIVRLTPEGIAYATAVGNERVRQNLRNRARNRYGQTGPGFAEHQTGAIAEYALSVHTGLPWDGALGRYRADDVGPYQVRGTRRAGGRLFLHPRDADEKVFVLGLVSADGRTVRLRGWIRAGAGKIMRWWSSPQHGRPCWAVPQTVLADMRTLPDPATLGWAGPRPDVRGPS